MKTKLSIATTTSSLVLLLSACGLMGVTGSGEIIRESRAVSNYSRITFAAPGELTIVQDGSEGLIIEGDDNLLPYIKTSVTGGVLRIYTEPAIPILLYTKPIQYTLNVDVLTSVVLDGSGNIRSDELEGDSLDLELNGSGNFEIGTFKGDESLLELDGSGNFAFEQIQVNALNVRLDGSGDFRLGELTAKTLELIVNGSGSIRAAGSTDEAEIVVNGSGAVRAEELECQIAGVRITGSGSAQLWVTESLDIVITGSGGVTYKGRPSVTQTITGSGSVRNVPDD